MNELWLAIILVVIFSIGFIYFSVSRDLKVQPDLGSSGNLRKVLFLPLILLILTPVAYFYWGTYQKQQSWDLVAQKTDQLLVKGKLDEVDMSMQDLVLGIRTQAHQNPLNGMLWFELGQTYANLKMRDYALAAFQRANRVTNNPDWQVATAQILVSGNVEEETSQGVDLLKQVINQYPDHQSALLTLGFSYFKLAKYQQAIKTWEVLANQKSISPQSQSFIQQQITEAQRLATAANLK